MGYKPVQSSKKALTRSSVESKRSLWFSDQVSQTYSNAFLLILLLSILFRDRYSTNLTFSAHWYLSSSSSQCAPRASLASTHHASQADESFPLLDYSFLHRCCSSLLHQRTLGGSSPWSDFHSSCLGCCDSLGSHHLSLRHSSYRWMCSAIHLLSQWSARSQ